jgi:hypothetical protein
VRPLVDLVASVKHFRPAPEPIVLFACGLSGNISFDLTASKQLALGNGFEVVLPGREAPVAAAAGDQHQVNAVLKEEQGVERRRPFLAPVMVGKVPGRIIAVPRRHARAVRGSDLWTQRRLRQAPPYPRGVETLEHAPEAA